VLGWAGLGWAGLGWAGLGWAGLGWADASEVESSPSLARLNARRAWPGGRLWASPGPVRSRDHPPSSHPAPRSPTQPAERSDRQRRPPPAAPNARPPPPSRHHLRPPAPQVEAAAKAHVAANAADFASANVTMSMSALEEPFKVGPRAGAGWRLGWCRGCRARAGGAGVLLLGVQGALLLGGGCAWWRRSSAQNQPRC
jgi:hypothetical protein